MIIRNVQLRKVFFRTVFVGNPKINNHIYPDRIISESISSDRIILGDFVAYIVGLTGLPSREAIQKYTERQHTQRNIPKPYDQYLTNTVVGLRIPGKCFPDKYFPERYSRTLLDLRN